MKKRMKKLLCLSMTIGCICASLVGCGSSDSKNVDSAKKSDDSSALKGSKLKILLKFHTTATIGRLEQTSLPIVLQHFFHQCNSVVALIFFFSG